MFKFIGGTVVMGFAAFGFCMWFRNTYMHENDHITDRTQ